MRWYSAGFNRNQNFMLNGQALRGNQMEFKSSKASSQINKFGGVWLPVPTFLGIVSTIFWTWLILRTVGYEEKRLEKIIKPILDRF